MADMSAATRRKATQQRQAMAGGRFPVRNRADLANAIRAVGRVQPATEEARAAVRRFITKRAKVLGAADMIPDMWNADGSLKG